MLRPGHGPSRRSDYLTVDKLRSEIAQEQHTVDNLEQSLAELRATIDELERKKQGLSVENSRWEIRYALQLEMNQQLDIQALVLTERIEQAKQFFSDDKFPRTTQMFEDTTDEITSQYLQRLEHSKLIFAEQIRNLEWRLEQESKAYHKANEERKNIIMEINALNNETARTNFRNEASVRHGREYKDSPAMAGSLTSLIIPDLSPDCSRKVITNKPQGTKDVPWIRGLIVDL